MQPTKRQDRMRINLRTRMETTSMQICVLIETLLATSRLEVEHHAPLSAITRSSIVIKLSLCVRSLRHNRGDKLDLSRNRLDY